MNNWKLKFCKNNTIYNHIKNCCCSLAAVISAWTAPSQASMSFTVFQSLLKFVSIEAVCYLTISFLVLFSFYLQFSPASRSLSGVSSYHQVAKVLEFQLQHQSFQWVFRVDFPEDWVWSPCCPRNSQESSPSPQFKSINSSASPDLTSVHDYWKNHNFDYTDLC